MKHLDLFSGIGGFALAAYWVWEDQHKITAFCEQDKFCQQVLRKHWPGVPIIKDVRDVKEIQQYCSTTVDLLTGGFPCQGFSVAGKRRGKKDDRYLWPEMLEIIKAVRPHWIIGENVAGIVSLALDTVLSDLEAEGYACQTFIIPACAQNAPHRRDRVWIVAHSPRLGRRSCTANKQSYVADTQGRQNNRRKGRIVEETEGQWEGGNSPFNSCCEDVVNTSSKRCEEQLRSVSKEGGRFECGSGGQPQLRLGIPDDGFPRWLVRAWGTEEWEEGVPRTAPRAKGRVNKLRALGNAICIPTVLPIMRAIKCIDECGVPSRHGLGQGAKLLRGLK